MPDDPNDQDDTEADEARAPEPEAPDADDEPDWSSTDLEARRARARLIEESIADLLDGAPDEDRPLSPREITDRAAREA